LYALATFIHPESTTCVTTAWVRRPVAKMKREMNMTLNQCPSFTTAHTVYINSKLFFYDTALASTVNRTF
jgi:hypothetical protein